MHEIARVAVEDRGEDPFVVAPAALQATGDGERGAHAGGEDSAYRGVDTATATLAGARSAPTVHLDVAVETHAPVADLRDRITDEALPRLRTALRMDRLPAQLVLRLDAHNGTRRVR